MRGVMQEMSLGLALSWGALQVCEWEGGSKSARHPMLWVGCSVLMFAFNRLVVCCLTFAYGKRGFGVLFENENFPFWYRFLTVSRKLSRALCEVLVDRRSTFRKFRL